MIRSVSIDCVTCTGKARLAQLRPRLVHGSVGIGLGHTRVLLCLLLQAGHRSLPLGRHKLHSCCGAGPRVDLLPALRPCLTFCNKKAWLFLVCDCATSFAIRKFALASHQTDKSEKTRPLSLA